MNLEQWTKFNELPDDRTTVSAVEIGGPDRTVLLGFTCERLTWHVYLADGQIHLVVYKDQTGHVTTHQARSSWDAYELIPDKRAYPESVDERFAHLMRARGIAIPYRSWDERRAERFAPLAFHGATISQTDFAPEHRQDPAPTLGPEGTDNLVDHETRPWDDDLGPE